MELRNETYAKPKNNTKLIRQPKGLFDGPYRAKCSISTSMLTTAGQPNIADFEIDWGTYTGAITTFTSNPSQTVEFFQLKNVFCEYRVLGVKYTIKFPQGVSYNGPNVVTANSMIGLVELQKASFVNRTAFYANGAATNPEIVKAYDYESVACVGQVSGYKDLSKYWKSVGGQQWKAITPATLLVEPYISNGAGGNNCFTLLRVYTTGLTNATVVAVASLDIDYYVEFRYVNV